MAASLLLPLASCTDTTTGEPDTDARAIAFTPAAETRAAVDNADDMADGFNVWGWYSKDGSNTYNVFDGVTVTKGSDGWGYDGGTQYWIPGMKYNFYGVYPANIGECTDKGIITVSNFDCSKMGEDAVDLMTATAKGDGSNPESVAMPFKHELVRVNFIIKATRTKATVTSVKVYGVNYKGSLNPTSDKDSWQGVTACKKEDTPYKNLVHKELNTTDGLEYNPFGDLLLIPDKDLTDAKLEIAYHYPGETADRTATVSLNMDGKTTVWEAGKSYKYTATLSGSTLNISVTINEWTEKNTSVDW